MQSVEITRAQKITVLKREVAMRQRVYPRMVLAGKMSEADAERETAVMAAVLADYVVHEDVDMAGMQDAARLVALLVVAIPWLVSIAVNLAVGWS